MPLLPIYLFYMLKSFTPFTPFLVPYLIDIKKFKNKEVYNKLNVYFFISSLIVSLFVFIIVRLFGNRLSLFLDTLLEIIACSLLYIMDDRNFLLGKLISTLHGSSTALNSVLKSVVVSNSGKDKDEMKSIMNNITIVKCVSSIFSAWIGQDIVISINKYDLNLIISLITLSMSLLVTFFIHQSEGQGTIKNTIFQEISNNFSLFSDYEIVSHCLLSITANILVICLSFFSANVFIERRKCGRNSFIKNIFFIMAPFRYISFFLIKIYIYLGNHMKEDKKEKGDEHDMKDAQGDEHDMKDAQGDKHDMKDAPGDKEEKKYKHDMKDAQGDKDDKEYTQDNKEYKHDTQDNKEENKKELVIHGYIDGISKICSAIICFYMGSIKISDNFRYPLSLGITGLTITSLFFLYLVNSLSMSYLFFTIAFSLSTSIKIILYASYNIHAYKNFIFSLNMFVSSLIHVVLCYLSIYKKANVQQRFRYYFYVSLFLTSSSIGLYLLRNKLI